MEPETETQLRCKLCNKPIVGDPLPGDSPGQYLHWEENLSGIQCKTCKAYFCGECSNRELNRKNDSFGGWSFFTKTECPKCMYPIGPAYIFPRPGYNSNAVWLLNRRDVSKKLPIGFLMLLGGFAFFIVLGFLFSAFGKSTIIGIILFAVGTILVGYAWLFLKNIPALIKDCLRYRRAENYFSLSCSQCGESVQVLMVDLEYACQNCGKTVSTYLDGKKYMAQALITGFNCDSCNMPNPMGNRPAVFRCHKCGKLTDLEKIPSISIPTSEIPQSVTTTSTGETPELISAQPVIHDHGSSELVHPAPNMDLLPPPFEWCDIPAGRVTLEGNAGTFDVKPFRMARFPITVAQFQVFIDASDGFKDDRWWRNLAHQDRKPAWQPNKIATQPRDRVTWYASIAFCRWLSHQVGCEIRLPTEWEWQWAAQGPDGRQYPWGNGYLQGYANIDEKATNIKDGVTLGKITDVDQYPQGVSPYGVLDMVGNVWEWCLNEYAIPANTSVAERSDRTVRGGSFLNNMKQARCAIRHKFIPGIYLGGLGFRVIQPLANPVP